jgi:hypothetical protein
LYFIERAAAGRLPSRPLWPTGQCLRGSIRSLLGSAPTSGSHIAQLSLLTGKWNLHEFGEVAVLFLQESICSLLNGPGCWNYGSLEKEAQRIVRKWTASSGAERRKMRARMGGKNGHRIWKNRNQDENSSGCASCFVIIVANHSH